MHTIEKIVMFILARGGFVDVYHFTEGEIESVDFKTRKSGHAVARKLCAKYGMNYYVVEKVVSIPARPTETPQVLCDELSAMAGGVIWGGSNADDMRAICD